MISISRELDFDFDYEIRVSFVDRGRTLGGYAHWSLSGPNWIRLYVASIWNATARDALRVARRDRIETRIETTNRALDRAIHETFVSNLVYVITHEVLHLVYHRDRDVRALARRRRTREQNVHHVASRKLEREA